MLAAANVAIVAEGGRPLTWDRMPDHQRTTISGRQLGEDEARFEWARLCYAVNTGNEPPPPYSWTGTEAEWRASVEESRRRHGVVA